MVAIILKYRSANLIILIHCTYSGLLDTMGVITQNSIGLIRIQDLVLRLMGDWNRVWSALEEGGKCADVRWYVTVFKNWQIFYKSPVWQFTIVSILLTLISSVQLTHLFLSVLSLLNSASTSKVATKQYINSEVHKLEPRSFWEDCNTMDFDKFSYLLNSD